MRSHFETNRDGQQEIGGGAEGERVSDTRGSARRRRKTYIMVKLVNG